MVSSTRLALAGLAMAGVAGCAMFDRGPAVERFTAQLNGAQEVPAVTTAATGSATATLDPTTKVLTYTISYAGLSGPVAAAHFHGPAAAGANAGPVVTIAVTPSPINGTATLTDPQLADLRAGRWYVNLHTGANRGGEVRGQVVGGR